MKMKVSVSKWVVAILICLAFILPVEQNVVASQEREKNLDPAMIAQAINSTIQIRIFAPTMVHGHYVMAQGLGSLVMNAGEMQIVTHNHWGETLKNAEFVRFYDCADNLLVEMNVNSFNQAVLAQDAGTLLLEVPNEVKTRMQALNVTDLAANGDVQAGDIVLVAHQADENTGRVDILEARVADRSTYKQLPVFKLQTLDGQPIVSGDSGGGVWLDGKLVGNIWGRETVQQQAGWGALDWLKPDLPMIEVDFAAQFPSYLNTVNK